MVIGACGIMEYKKRIIGLDLLRSIAIFLVMWQHSTAILNPFLQIPVFGKYFGKMLATTQSFGDLGVELFFVLSGFLIGTILIKIYLKAKHFGFGELQNFWVRRWLRTIPNYFLVLTLAIFIWHIRLKVGISWSMASYYFFIQNFFQPQHVFFPDAWSLAIEEWFYLTLPVCIFISSRIFRNYDKRKLLFKVFVAYLLIFLCIRFFNAFNPGHNMSERDIRITTFLRLDAVMYGVLIGYYMYFKPQKLLKYKNTLLGLGIAGVVVTVLVLYIGSHPAFMLYEKNRYFRFFVNSSEFTLLPLFFSLCLPFASSIGEFRSKLFNKTVVMGSKISYSVYLINLSILYVPFISKIPNESILSSVFIYILFWVAVPGLSYFLYTYFEHPIMSYRDKIFVEKTA